MKIKIITLTIFQFFITKSLAWVSVGSPLSFGSCTYSNIQDALDSYDGEIRVLNDSNFNQGFEENLVVDHSVDIRGGFSTCLTASLNQQGATNSVIKGIATIGSPVVKIMAMDEPIIQF